MGAGGLPSALAAASPLPWQSGPARGPSHTTGRCRPDTPARGSQPHPPDRPRRLSRGGLPPPVSKSSTRSRRAETRPPPEAPAPCLPTVPSTDPRLTGTRRPTSAGTCPRLPLCPSARPDPGSCAPGPPGCSPAGTTAPSSSSSHLLSLSGGGRHPCSLGPNKCSFHHVAFFNPPFCVFTEHFCTEGLTFMHFLLFLFMWELLQKQSWSPPRPW